MNEEGKPDTVLLDIMTKYDLQVHTIPPVWKDSIVLEPGIHNIIELPAPQGYLKTSVAGDNPADNAIQVIVRKNGEMNTLNIQGGNSVQKYITGTYDLEFLSLPRIVIDDVEISQSDISKVVIPEPGTIKIDFQDHPIGSILHEEGDKQEKIHTLNPYKKELVLRLQPGTYRLVYRYANDNKTKNSVEKQFKIKSGKTLIVKTD